MDLLTHWIESVQLFLPNNFKPFVLVTIRAVEIALKNFFSSLWWFFLGIVALYVSLDVLLLVSTGAVTYIVAWLLTLFFSLLLALFLFLSLRPSIRLKSVSYYLGYSWYNVYCILLLVIVLLLAIILQGILPYDLNDTLLSLVTIENFFIPIVIIPILLFSPLLIFIILFVLDSDGTPYSFLWSLVRGAKMLIYNYPVCYFFYLVFYAFNIGIAKLYYFLIIYTTVPVEPSLWTWGGILVLNRIIFFSAYLLGGVIPLAFFTNLYIKKVHDQYGLYFEQ